MTMEMQHKCPLLPAEGVDIVRAEQVLESDRWAWCLMISQTATEDDLEENHHLEEVGELLWQTNVGINHCPFCGEHLPNASRRSPPPEADFHHVN